MPLLGLMQERAAPPPPVIAQPAHIPQRIPRRLQRSRKRGAKLPPRAVYVGRRTLFGNPFPAERFGHARSVLMHAKWLEGSLSDLELERRGFCAAEIDALHRHRDRVLRNLHRLTRRDIACWCPLTSRWCHADTLLRAANPDIQPGVFFDAGSAR